MRIGSLQWNRKIVVLPALAVLLLAGAPPIATQEKPYPELDKQIQPLKNQFNADAGKVRLLLILDPT